MTQFEGSVLVFPYCAFELYGLVPSGQEEARGRKCFNSWRRLYGTQKEATCDFLGVTLDLQNKITNIECNYIILQTITEYSYLIKLFNEPEILCF